MCSRGGLVPRDSWGLSSESVTAGTTTDPMDIKSHARHFQQISNFIHGIFLSAAAWTGRPCKRRCEKEILHRLKTANYILHRVGLDMVFPSSSLPSPSFPILSLHLPFTKWHSSLRCIDGVGCRHCSALNYSICSSCPSRTYLQKGSRAKHGI